VADEEGEARLGYISVGSSGDTSLTFNATSIQNAVILGLFLLVLGALLLPLFNMEEEEDGYGQSYGYEEPATGYEDPATGYQGYAKRSLLNNFAPLLEGLSNTQRKYEEPEEHPLPQY